MKTFKEYLENREVIEEGAITTLTSLAVSSWIIYMTYKYGKKFVLNMANKYNLKSPDLQKLKQKFSNKINDPSIKSVESEFEKINDKYEEELMHIYNAIEEKDWEEAKNEYKLLNKNKEIKQCIVEKIVDVCGEPPIYINSPGNETYRVIKKIMGQQFAIQITNAFSEKIKKEFKDFMGDYEG